MDEVIDRILLKDLGFRTTTKDRCIYIKKIDGCIILLLRQVDDFCCACTREQDAKDIYNIIGTKIQFKSERDKGDLPFEYLGVVKDYNGCDLVQTKKYIEMNCSNYINRFLRSHGWDVASDQPDAVPNPVQHDDWDLWEEAGRQCRLKNARNNNNDDITHAPAASVTTTVQPPGNLFEPAPDLSDDELVNLQLKDNNDNNDYAFIPKLPKGKVNKNNFEDCMKSSKPISPIPSGSIDQMFKDKGPPEGTAAHQVLETNRGFS